MKAMFANLNKIMLTYVERMRKFINLREES
jgi:hypothetical protein